MKEIIIAPSLLSGDFNNLSTELKRLEDYHISYLHFDVMDGHFVPNISFGAPILQSLKPHYSFIMDVHLMISDPLFYIESFVKSGADILTIHYESYQDKEQVKACLDQIHSFHVKAGLSIKPNTNVEVLLPFLDKLDMVLIMSVEPGFGGQSFMESALDKITYLRKYIDEHHLSCLISVDGGINDVTGAKCVAAGTDIVVAGSYLFNKPDLLERIQRLKGVTK